MTCVEIKFIIIIIIIIIIINGMVYFHWQEWYIHV